MTAPCPVAPVAASRRTRSGFVQLHVISATRADAAAKAVLSCRSMLETYPEISHYTLIVDDASPRLWSALADEPRVSVRDESLVYGKREWAALYPRIAALSPDRSGWYYQQILKLACVNQTAVALAAAGHPTGAGIVIWDADTRILRPIPFMSPEAARTYSYFTRSPHARHAPFFAINALLSGTPPDRHQPHSNIVQFAALSVDEALALPAFIGLEATMPGYAGALAARIADAVVTAGVANRALFSEYELIGLYKRVCYSSPERLIRFIRPNNRLPDMRQLALMRRCGIAHYTHEEWFGSPAPMTFTYLAAQIAIQYVPALEAVKNAIVRHT